MAPVRNVLAALFFTRVTYGDGYPIAIDVTKIPLGAVCRQLQDGTAFVQLRQIVASPLIV